MRALAMRARAPCAVYLIGARGDLHLEAEHFIYQGRCLS
jgi:hypothetical protein